jgi:hypothetical protein
MIQHPTQDAWPNVPAIDRYQRPAFAHDHLYRNERGLLEHASASGGEAHLAYLAKLQTGSANSGFLSAWSKREHQRLVPQPASSSLYELVEARLGTKIVCYPLSALIKLTGQIFLLVRHFLETNYVLWPTFHLPTFLATLATVRSNQDPEFICLLVAIAYMALRERRTRKDLGEDTAEEFAQLCKLIPSSLLIRCTS